MAAPPELPGSPDAETVASKRPRGKRRRRGLMPVVILGVALAASLAVLAYSLVQLDAATTRIDEQNRQIDEQKDLIDKKETFGAAMQSLMDTAGEFDGVLLAAVVPIDHYQAVATRAWSDRWNALELDGDIADVKAASNQLQDILDAANTEATTNVTGTTNEAVIDQLGGGLVASLLDNADEQCQADALACVISDDPYTVHFDLASSALPYMNDWLRTGVAYHEFAHVLQLTNPDPTAVALESFGGDRETMADCFALTYLDGWTLDHRIWVSTHEYWDVNIGYGYTCTEAQKQVMRDWYSELGVHIEPISQ